MPFDSVALVNTSLIARSAGPLRVASRRFFFLGHFLANRTTFLIDGFNLYHSVKEASEHLSGASTKWLDIPKLCNSFLHILGNGAAICQIYYFSALATFSRDPRRIRRHRDYIRCLESANVIVPLGRFKEKRVWCEGCGTEILKNEEKE